MTPTRPTLAAMVALAVTLTACGGSNDASPASTTATSTVDSEAPIPTTSEAPSSTAASPPSATTPPPPSTAAVTTVAEPAADWRVQVTAACDGAGPLLAAIPPNDGTAASIAAEAVATRAVFEAAALNSVELPAEIQATARRIATMAEEAVDHLDSSVELAGAGDTAGAQRALDEGSDRLSRTATAWAMAGARCGPADPARVQNADLTVPLEMGSGQLNTGFGSIWVSEELAGRVVRLDPDTGEVQAAIEVGDRPLKLQPADGRMWVRTAASYVAIDPVTNTVVDTLVKADVGPSANRSWAVDGAMWICDGNRLHRYDPVTVTLVATIDLELECGAIHAGDDLAVAWSYNEDPGESGTSAAAFIDPATNTVLATVPLPVDVSGPALLENAVFFPGYLGSTAVVVDPSTWTVTATPDLGVPAGGTGQPAYDDTSIYIVTADHQDVLRVDGASFAITEAIEPLGVNAVVVDDGVLWVARDQPVNIAQRFDLSGAP